MFHPIFGSFRLNEKGYARINAGPHRDKFLHRAVFENVAGRPIKPDHQIHHMNGKQCVCPHQLIELQACLHPPPEPLRCPFTGMFLKPAEFERRLGVGAMRAGGGVERHECA